MIEASENGMETLGHYRDNHPPDPANALAAELATRADTVLSQILIGRYTVELELDPSKTLAIAAALTRHFRADDDGNLYSRPVRLRYACVWAVAQSPDVACFLYFGIKDEIWFDDTARHPAVRDDYDRFLAHIHPFLDHPDTVE